MKTTLLSVCVLSLFAACGTKGSEVIAPGGGKQPPAASEGHGAPTELGSLTIGAHTFRVIQLGAITAGKEGAIELAFPADKPVPSTVRLWVGIESGEGSVKQPCGKEGEHGLHGHVEVPKTFPAGSKLWIEIEANGQALRGSIAWQ